MRYPTDEDIVEGMDLALKNAEQFIEDSEILMRGSSYGHALGLAELAIEEIGRTHLMLQHLFGFITDEELHEGLTLHGSKLEGFMALDITRRLEERERFFEILAKAIMVWIGEKELEEVELTEEDLETLVRELPRFQRKFGGFAESTKRKRHRGFYIDWDGTTWVSPEDIPRDYVEELLVVARRNLQLYRGKYLLIATIAPPSIKAKSKLFFDRFKEKMAELEQSVKRSDEEEDQRGSHS